MALPHQTDDLDEERLFERHVDLDDDRYGGLADAGITINEA